MIDWTTTAARYPEQREGSLALESLACLLLPGEPDVAFVVFARKRLPAEVFPPLDPAEILVFPLQVCKDHLQQWGSLEGPNLRSSPRTLFCCCAELRFGDDTVRLERALGNVSIHGLLLRNLSLPVNTAVHIKLITDLLVEVEGVVRFCEAESTGIEFTNLTAPNRRRLDVMIDDFMRKEVLAR